MQHRTQSWVVGDMVFGANDGIITTFAVVASLAGADLSGGIVLVLGLANLLGDGVSMAAGNYLGKKTEKDAGIESAPEHPSRNALAMFGAFVGAGVVPLVPYMFPTLESRFAYSLFATGVALFGVGSLRSIVTGKPWHRSGVEMLTIGAVAAGVAYAVGSLAGRFL